MQQPSVAAGSFAAPPDPSARVDARRYDVDWLRVVATGLVFLFHSARFFDFDDWHVKSAETTLGFTILVIVLSQIIMPLFFILSGISAYYALGSQQGRYLPERAKRLLVPLAFGIFVLSPHQIYLERLTHGQFRGSFLEWLPQYFDGLYAFGGNFAWMGVHLWYLLVLLLFSLLTLPLFAYLRSASGRRFVGGLVGLLARPGMLLVPIIPLIAAEYVNNLDPDGWGMEDMGGWNVVVYLVLFVYGYLFLADERLRASIRRQRWVALGAGLVLLTVGLAMASVQESGASSAALALAMVVVRSANVWAWLIALLGLGLAYLGFSNPTLRYANEAVLPWYILHQPVILLVGYLVVLPLDLPVLAKYLLVLAISFPIILGLYELVVRRVGVLRFLFGLKPARPAPAGRASPARA